MTAKEFLFSKYPLVSPEWFDEAELTKEMITMMKEFHEAKLKEITDADIEAWADKEAFQVPYDGSNNFYDERYLKGLIVGAKAVLNGEIKHTEK